MDISDLVKQAKNHEQPLKERIPPKRKEKPDHKDRIKLLEKNISISTENFSVLNDFSI
jgi:hypothetical protein